MPTYGKWGLTKWGQSLWGEPTPPGLPAGFLISSSDISQMTIRYALNEIPTARVLLNNKDGKYTSGSRSFREGTDVLISSSLDAGLSYYRPFSGSIAKAVSRLSANGEETLDLSMRDERLVRRYVTFNNAVIAGKDIGAVFTGSPTASDGTTWGVDANGNYPNGLLRDSEFTLSLLTPDLYPGFPDVPLVVFQREPVYDAMRRVTGLYGLLFGMTPTDNVLKVLRDRDEFPSFSGAKIEHGVDINSSELTYDNLYSYSGVLVVGKPPVFWQTGSTGSVYELVDNNISSFAEASERAREWMRLNSASMRAGTVEVPAYTFSILGRRISIVDPKHGWTGVGDVRGVEHDIRSDRWTTRLTIENAERTPQRLLADIKEEIDDLKGQKEFASVYHGFEFFSSTDPRMTTTSAVTGTVVAMGVGTGSGGGLTPSGIIDVRPVIAPVSTSDGALRTVYAAFGQNFGRSYDFTASSARIREIVFLVGSGSNKELSLLSKSFTFLRPSSASGFTGSAAFEASMSPYVVSVESIVADGQTYFPKDGISDVRFQTFTESTGVPSPTVSNWYASDVITASSADRQSMSWDAFFSKSDGYWNVTGTVPSGRKALAARWGIKPGLSEKEMQEADQIVITVVAKAAYVITGSGTPIGSWQVDLWRGEFGWYNIAGSPGIANEWRTLSAAVSLPSFATALNEASIFLAIKAPPGQTFQLSASTPYTLSVAYMDLGIVRGTSSEVVEAGVVQAAGAELRVSSPIKRVIGIYTTSSGTGAEFSEFAGTIVSKRQLEWWQYYWGYIPGETDRVIENVFVPRAKEKGNVLISDPPMDWNERLRIAKTINAAISTFYVKYIPETETLGKEDFTDGGGWLLQRSKVGGTDSVKWLMDTGSDLRSRQDPPAYRMPYTILYRAPRDGNSLHARLVDSVGWDKTPQKTLTIAFQKPNEGVSGGAGGDGIIQIV